MLYTIVFVVTSAFFSPYSSDLIGVYTHDALEFREKKIIQSKNDDAIVWENALEVFTRQLIFSIQIELCFEIKVGMMIKFLDKERYPT